MEHMKTPTVLYTASRRKSTKPRHKNEVQSNVFEDEELEETHFMDVDTDQQKIQKIKITLGGQKSKPFGSPYVPQQDYPDEESTSDSSSYSDSRLNGSEVEVVSIRKPIYWLEMRGIQPVPSVSEQQQPTRGGVLLPRKRGLPAEDEDYEVYPTKINSPRSQRYVHEGMNSIRKPKSRYVKKEPPTYPPGSQEELWNLEVLHRGKVTCPLCRAVVRKTVEGLKKHMANCRQEPYTCQHCGKQLKSLAGMKYHVMADHNNKPLSEDGSGPSERERLRKVLKRLGKLKCSREGCTASFASIMGYTYHMKKCGKEASELEEMMLKCTECGKRYNSKAGLDYHTRSEHAPASLSVDGANENVEAGNDLIIGEKSQRKSAKVAAFHLQQIASEELTKEWPKRKVLEDLVPDDRKLKYTRPGMPTFSQEVIRKWNNEIKIYRKVQCPNKGCDSVYTSVSGLKAHLGCCHMGDFAGGTYRCLLCNKQFHSESGVKYHITSVHSQEWFIVNPKTTKSFEKQMKMAQKGEKLKKQKKRFITRVLAVKRAGNSLHAAPRHNVMVRQEHPQVVEISSESDGNSSAEEDHVFERPNWNIKKPMTKVMMKTVHGRK